jgi:hypothetical protein
MVGSPAIERSESEHKLSEFEGLREIVVSAELEAGGLVVESVSGGEHENRHAATRRNDALGDLVARWPGYVAVENGDVVRIDVQELQSSATVGCDIGGDRFHAQAITDGFCHVGLIFDDQNTHIQSSVRAGTYRRRIKNAISADNITFA